MDLLQFHGGFGFKETKKLMKLGLCGGSDYVSRSNDPALSRVTSSLPYLARVLTWARDRWEIQSWDGLGAF
jgi:hypothetical protein